LEIPRRKADDYPRLFTLNNAKILGFEPAHDPNQDHIRNSGAWGTNPLKYLGGPQIFYKFDGFDLTDKGLWGRPAGGHLFQGAQLQPELCAIRYQNRHSKKGTTAGIYGSLGS
jgi:hypothetical protein